MNQKIVTQLEFDKIRHQVAQHASSDLGQQLCQQLAPSADRDEVQRWLNETSDGGTILRLAGGIPLPQLRDVRQGVQRLKIGADLNGAELAAMMRVLTTVQEVRRFFERLLEEDIPLRVLYDTAATLVSLPQESKRLKEALADDGSLYDDASDALRQLRQQIKRTEQTVRDTLDAIVRGPQAKYLSDAVVTLRNDRYVVPVKQEHRSVFGGIVHDQSASGQTLFVEPQRVVAHNNQLSQLRSAEQQEVLRLYSELSALLAPHHAVIEGNHLILAQLDMVQAKARYARDIAATEPLLDARHHVALYQARHPLLSPETVVPNDVLLGDTYQAIVITGPNTGGKTLLLKTIGLIQLMGQSGLFVPAAETSRIAVFDAVFADIGDEQSIEQNLSTFSSHMTNIVSILQQATDKSLLLLDEVGSGTDPQEGAALAIALLDYIGGLGSYVVATTHYPELKAYGYRQVGTINASMAFDGDTLAPTYQLLLGIPGRSNAFDISRRLGMPETVLLQAQESLAHDSQQLNDVIADLEAKRQQLLNERQAAQQQLAQAEALLSTLTKSKQQFDAQKDRLMEQAKQEANRLVAQTEAEVAAILQEVRDMQLRQGQSVVKEHEMIAQKTKLSQLHHQETLQRNKVLQKAKRQQALKAGDTVMVSSYGQRGTLIEPIGAKQWLVQMGAMKMKVSREEIQVVAAEKGPSVKRRVATVQSARDSHVSSQLDLRGVRYEEALVQLDRYLDAALLAGYGQVTIVHGKGTGTLREGVTQALRRHPSVSQFAYAAPQLGGNGATVVQFKG